MTMSPTQPPHLARTLDLASLLARKSHFLLGPRQTGKTTLIRGGLPRVRASGPLAGGAFLPPARSPGRLAEELDAKTKVVAIAEIQRLPEPLNEVHRLIEE